MEKMVEIKLKADRKVIEETLSRIGIPNKKKKIIYPSCYLYEKDEKFYLVHFKQLFILERENAYDNICEEDFIRRNSIAYCLKQWDLIEVDEEKIDPHTSYVFVLKNKDRKEWTIKHKYDLRYKV